MGQRQLDRFPWGYGGYGFYKHPWTLWVCRVAHPSLGRAPLRWRTLQKLLPDEATRTPAQEMLPLPVLDARTVITRAKSQDICWAWWRRKETIYLKNLKNYPEHVAMLLPTGCPQPVPELVRVAKSGLFPRRPWIPTINKDIEMSSARQGDREIGMMWARFPRKYIPHLICTDTHKGQKSKRNEHLSTKRHLQECLFFIHSW